MAHVSTAQKPLMNASADYDSVFATVCALLAPFNRHAIALQSDTDIISDMEVDSVAIFDLVMEVEDTYEVAFPMETIADMKTIGDLVSTVQQLTAN